MFEVRLTYEMGDDWQEVDERIRAAADRTSEWSGAGRAGRDHGWHVDTLADALALKAKLETVAGVNVTVREATTNLAPVEGENP